MIRKTKNLILIVLTLNLMFVFQGCKKDDGDGFQLNLFTVQDDVTFGMQVRDEIASNPADFQMNLFFV